MLYLIRTFGRVQKQRALKVGFSEDIGKRESSYYHQNPFFEKVSTRQGTLTQETKMHLYLEALGYKESFLKEWFLDVPEVLQRFHDSEDRMDKVIWKNRQVLFIQRDFKPKGNSIKKEIYENLRNKYYSSKHNLRIDIEWKMAIGVEKLKEMRKNYDEI